MKEMDENTARVMLANGKIKIFFFYLNEQVFGQ